MELKRKITIRLYNADLKKIRQYMKNYKQRQFDSTSHFIRCAIINFERQLDKEVK